MQPACFASLDSLVFFPFPLFFFGGGGRVAVCFRPDVFGVQYVGLWVFFHLCDTLDQFIYYCKKKSWGNIVFLLQWDLYLTDVLSLFWNKPCVCERFVLSLVVLPRCYWPAMSNISSLERWQYFALQQWDYLLISISVSAKPADSGQTNKPVHVTCSFYFSSEWEKEHGAVKVYEVCQQTKHPTSFLSAFHVSDHHLLSRGSWCMHQSLSLPGFLAIASAHVWTANSNVPMN